MSSFDRYQLPSDAVHTLSAPREIADGGAIDYPGDRWGDFVGVAQDPRDTNAVWQGNQYTNVGGHMGHPRQRAPDGRRDVRRRSTPVRLLDSADRISARRGVRLEHAQDRSTSPAGSGSRTTPSRSPAT